MYNQTLHGLHKYCGNRQCKHPFTKESFQGYLPKTVVEVYVVMRCSKCNDVFAITMPTAYAKSYHSSLPKRSKSENGPITMQELMSMKKKLQSLNNLDELKAYYAENEQS